MDVLCKDVMLLLDQPLHYLELTGETRNHHGSGFVISSPEVLSLMPEDSRDLLDDVEVSILSGDEEGIDSTFRPLL